MQDSSSWLAGGGRWPQAPAVASVCAGALGVLLAPFVVGGAFGLAAIGLAHFHLRRRRVGRAPAWWGVGLGTLGLVLAAAVGSVSYRWSRQIEAMAEEDGAEPADLQRWRGVKAPPLSVRTVRGEALDLDALAGRRVVLSFWATWCGPCVKDVDRLNRLTELGKPGELVVLAISDEEPGVLARFARERALRYHVASARGLAAPYAEVVALPTTFFIDRRGVIQTIAAGPQDFETLRVRALEPDGSEPPRAAPPAAVAALPRADKGLKATQAWAAAIPEGRALCVGDWDGDGEPEALVAAGGRSLHVLAGTGERKAILHAAGPTARIDCGSRGGGGLRILGHEPWGRELAVFDGSGIRLWTHEARQGIAMARWADLDADGDDEIVIGGSKGLTALSHEGRLLWRAETGSVWSEAVLPRTPQTEAQLAVAEAGGRVRLFRADGGAGSALQPLGRHYSMLAAAVMDGRGGVQLLAYSLGRVVAFDLEGDVAWQSPALGGPASWRWPPLAAADFDADGSREWAFLEGPGTIVIASAKGEKLAQLAYPPDAAGFGVIPRRDAGALFAVLDRAGLKAYRLQ